tara:strand:+ start:340 stop:486 length:147 start_codon:yes stop_codon:yes gene_type:complete
MPTIYTDYDQETLQNQIRLLNILLDTNKKLERIATALEENKKSDGVTK